MSKNIKIKNEIQIVMKTVNLASFADLGLGFSDATHITHIVL